MGAAHLRSSMNLPGGVVDADEFLSKMLAGHLMLEAAMEQQEAAAASESRLSGGYGSTSDSDATDPDAEGEQPFTPRTPSSPAGGISSELAQRLARLQLAMDAHPAEAHRCMILYCIQVSTQWPGRQVPALKE